MVKRIRIPLLVSCGLILIFAATRGAGRGLELSPSAVDLRVEPGAEKTFEILLGNQVTTEGPLVLTVRPSPLYQNKNGEYKLRSESDQWDASPWLQVQPNRVSLAPGAEQKVVVKAKIPRGAVGTKVAAIVFEVAPEEKFRTPESIGGSTAFAQRLTTIVKITANNRANRRVAAIDGLAITTPQTDANLIMYGKEALAVKCAVANAGNTLLNTQGRLIIFNQAARRVKDVPLGGGVGVILPGATVDMTSIFPGGLAAGEYIGDVTIHYGGTRPLQAKIPFKVAGSGAAAGQSQIAPGGRLGVTPEHIESQLPGGAFRVFNILLANGESYPLSLTGSLKNLTSSPDGELITVDEDLQWTAVKWLKLDQTQITLAPGAKKILRVTAAIPKGASGGTHYAALVLEAARADAGKNGATSLISTPIMIATGTDLVRKAVLSGSGIVQTKQPGIWLIGGRVTNLGNTHLSLSGQVILSRRTDPPKTVGGMEYIGEAKWEEIDSFPLLEAPGWLLPGGYRFISAFYDKPLPPGEYQGIISVDYGEKAPLREKFVFKLVPKDAEKEK